MSMSPHQIFGRLHELKKWQQTHENLLRRSNIDEDFEKTSFNRSYSPSISDKNNEISTRIQESNMNSVFENSNLMQIKGAQGRNFQDLLEEKLSEYEKNLGQTEMDSLRTKKPFLIKGSGLMKYNLKPEDYKKLIGNKCSNTVPQHRIRPKSVQNSKKPLQSVPVRPKTSGQERQSNLIRKTQNCSRSNKTSTNNLQRSKATVSVYSKKVEPLKVTTFTNDKKKDLKDKQNTAYGLKKLGSSEDIENVIKSPQKLIINEVDKNPPKLKDFMETIMKNAANPVTFTPLKAPDLSIKPKGKWCSTAGTKFEDNDISHKGQWVDSFQQSDINHFRDKFAIQDIVQSEWNNEFGKQMNGIVNRIVEINNTTGLEKNTQESSFSNIELGARKSLSFTPKPTEQSLYDKALETELMIFEALERRTEQSGFCSTNTSIIQLLTSSPSRFNFKNAVNDVDHRHFDSIIDTNEDIEDQPVRDQNVTLTPNSDIFETASEESEVQHLENGEPSSAHWPTEDYVRLQKYITEELSDADTETEEEIDHIQVENNIHKYEKNASVNTDALSTQSSCYSSEHGDSSEDYSVESDKTYKTCKFSQLPRRSPDISESCTNCGFLIKNKIEECETELNNLKMEKNRIVAMREKMTRDKKEFEREMKTKKKKLDEQRRKFELQLEEEKRKISEKTPIDKPFKEIKSKLQHKKDREEISNLKVELNETKEMMKLRETKNAMSMARLRNQIKQLEKNNSELKAENEKLLKEKSKLVAQQKTHNKSTETKMLREISKNISKLTEEKFKNQLFKIDTSSEELIQGGCNGDSGKKNTKSVPGMKKVVAFSCHGHGEGPVEQKQTSKNNTKDIEDECIEEKYKSLFGGQDVILEDSLKDGKNPMENIKPSGLSKTEKLLEDGTKEIRYSNGNMKLISENGTVRYYYASNDTWHTNFTDGTEVLEFPNGQSEKRFKDGKCLIFFPDGLVQTIFPNGTEEVKYPDGSKLVTKKDGDRMLFLSNGQVEIHTKDQKRREYPDGTVKILYPDGSQETKYSNGRIRVKNKEGEIILDSGEQAFV